MERYGKYVACQIIEPDPKNLPHIREMNCGVYHTVWLNWLGDAPLTQEQARDVGCVDWSVKRVANMPEDIIPVGNFPPTIGPSNRDASLRSWKYNFWCCYHHLIGIRNLPEDLRLRRSEAEKKKLQQIYTVEVGDRAIHLDARKIDSDGKTKDDLRKLPNLDGVQCVEWHDWILDFIKEDRIRELVLKENFRHPEVNLRGTSLGRLKILTNATLDLHLNDGLEQLVVESRHPDLLNIHYEEKGRWLDLSLKGFVAYDNLPELMNLSCTECAEIDVEKIVSAYPNLYVLRIWGKPGYIRNFRAVTKLKKLTYFQTYSLFGFGAEDIPTPEEMPNLRTLWMTSLPADAAQEAKKLYKKLVSSGFDLSITQGRNPEWLTENLDNPFMNWDGQEFIPASAFKKATACYKKAKSEIRALSGSTGDVQSKLEAIVRSFVSEFNKMDERYDNFIETGEREEIFEAFLKLLGEIPPGLTVDKEALDRVFDEERKW
jgi:hypothetical protein